MPSAKRSAAVALRQVSLAVYALAVGATAFVPGGTAHHVGKRPATPIVGMGRIHSIKERSTGNIIDWAAAKLPTRGFRGPSKKQVAEILQTIERWAHERAAAEGVAILVEDPQVEAYMQGTKNLLMSMATEIRTNVPCYVLTLTAAGKRDDILAVATVISHPSWSQKTLDIDGLVVKPTSDQAHIATELITKMVRWAEKKDHFLLIGQYLDFELHHSDFLDSHPVAGRYAFNGEKFRLNAIQLKQPV